MAAESFINFFCSQQLYGYVENSNMAVTEFLYVTPRALIDNPLNVLKYIIFAIVLLMAAYFLYKGRKLENNGEVVAFSKLRPIFIYGVALCAGSVGYLYFNSIWDIHNILLLIPFGMIGIVIAEMIVKKSLKVRTVYKPVIIFCAAICVIQLCFQADLLGYERRIPAIDSIESAEFSPGVNMLRYDYSYNGKKVFYQEEDKGLRSVEDIDKVVRLHEELLKNRTGDEEYKSDDLTGVITYNLKNGRKITRAYEMNYNAHKEWLKPIVETLQIRKNYFPILKDNSKSIESIVVNDRRRSDSLQFYKNDKEVMDKIVEALRADVSNVIYDDFVSREEEFTEIEISYTRPAKYSDGSQVAEKFLPIIYERYYVRSSYKNTIAVLNELGFYKGIPSAEDIEAIGIILSDYESDTKSTIDVSVNNNENYSKYITDRADIAEIYDNCSRDMPKLGGSLVEFIVKGGRSFVINYDQNAEGIPDIMK